MLVVFCSVACVLLCWLRVVVLLVLCCESSVVLVAFCCVTCGLLCWLRPVVKVLLCCVMFCYVGCALLCYFCCVG